MTPACIDADPEAFFPEKGCDALPAIRVCLELCAAVNGTDVLDACIAKARKEMGDIWEPESVGVRGGLSARQLRFVHAGRMTADEARAHNLARLGLVEVSA